MLSGIFREKKVLILSEEMLTAHHPKNSWKSKIDRLYKYLCDFDPVVIFTIRNPVQALPSYFQEIFNSLDVYYQQNYLEFIHSDYCDVYKYKTFLGYLQKTGFTRIVVLDYDQLIEGKYCISDLIPVDSSITTDIEKITISLKKNNQSFSKDNKRYAKPVSLRKIINPLFNEIFANSNLFLKLRGRGIKTKILSLVPDMQLPMKALKTDLDLNCYWSFMQEYKDIKYRLLNEQSTIVNR